MPSSATTPEPRKAAGPVVPARQTAITSAAPPAVKTGQPEARPTAKTGQRTVKTGQAAARRTVKTGQPGARRTVKTGQAATRRAAQTGVRPTGPAAVRAEPPGEQGVSGQERPRATAAATGPRGHPAAAAATAPRTAAGAWYAQAAHARGPGGKRHRPGPAMRPARSSLTRSAQTSSTPKHAPSCTACRTI
jgi:hypothetical protein